MATGFKTTGTKKEGELSGGDSERPTKRGKDKDKKYESKLPTIISKERKKGILQKTRELINAKRKTVRQSFYDNASNEDGFSKLVEFMGVRASFNALEKNGKLKDHRIDSALTPRKQMRAIMALQGSSWSTGTKTIDNSFDRKAPADTLPEPASNDVMNLMVQLTKDQNTQTGDIACCKTSQNSVLIEELRQDTTYPDSIYSYEPPLNEINGNTILKGVYDIKSLPSLIKNEKDDGAKEVNESKNYYLYFSEEEFSDNIKVNESAVTREENIYSIDNVVSNFLDDGMLSSYPKALRIAEVSKNLQLHLFPQMKNVDVDVDDTPQAKSDNLRKENLQKGEASNSKDNYREDSSRAKIDYTRITPRFYRMAGEELGVAKVASSTPRRKLNSYMYNCPDGANQSVQVNPGCCDGPNPTSSSESDYSSSSYSDSDTLRQNSMGELGRLINSYTQIESILKHKKCVKVFASPKVQIDPEFDFENITESSSENVHGVNDRNSFLAKFPLVEKSDSNENKSQLLHIKDKEFSASVIAEKEILFEKEKGKIIEPDNDKILFFMDKYKSNLQYRNSNILSPLRLTPYPKFLMGQPINKERPKRKSKEGICNAETCRCGENRNASSLETVDKVNKGQQTSITLNPQHKDLKCYSSLPNIFEPCKCKLSSPDVKDMVINMTFCFDARSELLKRGEDEQARKFSRDPLQWGKNVLSLFYKSDKPKREDVEEIFSTIIAPQATLNSFSSEIITKKIHLDEKLANSTANSKAFRKSEKIDASDKNQGKINSLQESHEDQRLSHEDQRLSHEDQRPSQEDQWPKVISYHSKDSSKDETISKANRGINEIKLEPSIGTNLLKDQSYKEDEQGSKKTISSSEKLINIFYTKKGFQRDKGNTSLLFPKPISKVQSNDLISVDQIILNEKRDFQGLKAPSKRKLSKWCNCTSRSNPSNKRKSNIKNERVFSSKRKQRSFDSHPKLLSLVEQYNLPTTKGTISPNQSRMRRAKMKRKPRSYAKESSSLIRITHTFLSENLSCRNKSDKSVSICSSTSHIRRCPKQTKLSIKNNSWDKWSVEFNLGTDDSSPICKQEEMEYKSSSSCIYDESDSEGLDSAFRSIIINNEEEFSSIEEEENLPDVYLSKRTSGYVVSSQDRRHAKVEECYNPAFHKEDTLEVSNSASKLCDNQRHEDNSTSCVYGESYTKTTFLDTRRCRCDFFTSDDKSAKRKNVANRNSLRKLRLDKNKDAELAQDALEEDKEKRVVAESTTNSSNKIKSSPKQFRKMSTFSNSKSELGPDPSFREMPPIPGMKDEQCQTLFKPLRRKSSPPNAKDKKSPSPSLPLRNKPSFSNEKDKLSPSSSQSFGIKSLLSTSKTEQCSSSFKPLEGYSPLFLENDGLYHSDLFYRNSFVVKDLPTEIHNETTLFKTNSGTDQFKVEEFKPLDLSNVSFEKLLNMMIEKLAKTKQNQGAGIKHENGPINHEVGPMNHEAGPITQEVGPIEDENQFKNQASYFAEPQRRLTLINQAELLRGLIKSQNTANEKFIDLRKKLAESTELIREEIQKVD